MPAHRNVLPASITTSLPFIASTAFWIATESSVVPSPFAPNWHTLAQLVPCISFHRPPSVATMIVPLLSALVVSVESNQYGPPPPSPAA
ncbi:hypothetical protein D3C86_1614810 [compost metagenome]